ncbi:MAG: RagB/SusD family nutrient uptake outer membrane protein [Gelidibacter sp.]
MKNIKYLNKTSLVIITALIMSLGFTSCEEDFLDVPPTNAGESSTAIETVADAKVMLSGIMRRMTDLTYYGRNFIIYAEARGGEVTTRTLGRGLSDMYTFNNTPTSSSFEEFWNDMYNRILQTNYLIESIAKVQGEGNFDDIKGQALTLRAILYFDLVRIYGKPYTYEKASYGVPSILTPIDALDQPLRASVEENYKQIMIDLLAAESLLSKAKNDGYLNYYGNKAMQARVHLSMANYPGALAAAQDVINSQVYQLYSNSDWVDSWTKQFGSESIFELGIVPNENDRGNSSLSIYLRKQQYGSSSAGGQYFASDYYLDKLELDNADVRWGIMGDDREFASEAIHLGASYKYSGDINLSGDGKSTATAVNIKVIRLSEMYLIAAEAAFHSDKDLAATYLNAIRKRAPNLVPATAGTISIDMILDEKSKELFTEGQRYFDMLRLGKPITFNDDFGGVPVTRRPKTIDVTFERIVLPIPKNEINANPPIGAQQNPGY